MLAAHNDRENIYAHQAAAASKQQLQAKTPGARFPKTPLKVPLNDENLNNGLGGKSALRTRGNNENITTIGKAGMGKSGRANMKTPAGTLARQVIADKILRTSLRDSQNLELLERLSETKPRMPKPEGTSSQSASRTSFASLRRQPSNPLWPGRNKRPHNWSPPS